MVLDETRVRIIAEQLEVFHLAYVVHDLELLCEVSLHPLFDHVSSCHVTSNSSLQNQSVLLDHHEYFPMPSHPEDCLYLRSCLVDVCDSAPNEESFQSLLDLFSRDVKSEILFGSYCVFDPLEAVTLVPCNVTSQGSLHIPSCSPSNCLSRSVERVLDDSLRKHVAQQVLRQLVDVGTIES